MHFLFPGLALSQLRHWFLMPFLMLGLLSTPAMGDMSGFNIGGPIPDNNPGGINSTINFTTNEIISSLSLTIDFGPIVSGVSGHTYVGDLIATLTGPGGTIVLFDRIGVPASTFGDSSNLNGAYSWADGGGSFSAAAAAVGNNGIVGGGTYSAQNGNDAFLSFASTFAGTFTAGAWTLNISDRAGTDTGGFLSWNLKINSTPIPIPEPSSALVLAASLVIAGWWSSRKRKLEDQRSRSRFGRKFY